jgi:hypothetical protein
MTSNPRGFVLIINNEEFMFPGLPTRVGSRIDCESLVSVFEQCHFKLEVHHNKAREVFIEGATHELVELQM